MRKRAQSMGVEIDLGERGHAIRVGIDLGEKEVMQG